MSSPYQVTYQFYLDGTEEVLFHEMDGVEYGLREDDIVYFNGVGYKVESVILYLSDQTQTSGGRDVWSMVEELYKVYLSLLE